MLQRLIILLDVLCILWVGIWTIAFFGESDSGLIVMSVSLVVLVPYGLLRWVLVGSPIPFEDVNEKD